ncbi:kxDL motif-containing protein 1-like [Notamacropus eugenii]|uniref:kxDL motif-containing protein 1-like n=1 Tax=Notamacropus eugenii TaxID=9315 RepID=UPI003B67053B
MDNRKDNDFDYDDVILKVAIWSFGGRLRLLGLDRFEKPMLLNFNNLSNVRVQQMSERFIHHTRTLMEMKKNLDSIFRRLRTLKTKLSKQYPDAFSCIHESPILEEEDDDVDPIMASSATTIATSEQSTGSCDTSPDIISPVLSPDFEDLSQGWLDSPGMNGESLTVIF